MTATLTKPTLTDLIDALLDVALEKPDWVYPNTKILCMYTPDEDTPSNVGRCIIGEVVIGKLGLAEDEDFLYGNLVRHNSGTGAEDLLFALDVTDPKMRDLAARAQFKQDIGQTWAETVADAIAEADVSLSDEQENKYDRLRAHLNTPGA